jgi:hypothetical protein
LPKGHIGEELGHNAIDDGRRNCHNQETGEHAILHILHRIAKIPEGKAVEYTKDDRDKEFAIDVRGVAPVLSKHTFGQLNRLKPGGSGEL